MIVWGWGFGVGFVVVLVCLLGEQHEFGLIVFGFVLCVCGWRIVYFGVDMLIEMIEEVSC